MRDATVRTLMKLADEGKNFFVLAGDLGFKLFDPFREKYPSRFVDVGVAEQDMVGIAAGMTLAGTRVFCYSMVPFVLMRPFEQVRVDLCSQKLPVTLIGVGGGLSYGQEGMTHHAIEDIAIARSLPNLHVLAPGDPKEAELAVLSAWNWIHGPTFLRLGQNNDPVVHTRPINDLGKCLAVSGKGHANYMLTYGHILPVVAKAAEILSGRNLQFNLVSCPQLKPFDRKFVEDLSSTAECVVVVEEHSRIGGLGIEVSEILFEKGYRGKFLGIALPDEYCPIHGSLKYLRKHYGLDEASMAEKITNLMRKKSGV